MPGIILTKSATPVIGWVATLLGYIMEGIFYLLNLIGLPYIALAIIVFTIVIYMLMLPLTIKQQKFSKLSNKMNPELQAIQKKYNGKKDNDSMMAMQNETQGRLCQIWCFTYGQLCSDADTASYNLCFV